MLTHPFQRPQEGRGRSKGPMGRPLLTSAEAPLPKGRCNGHQLPPDGCSCNRFAAAFLWMSRMDERVVAAKNAWSWRGNIRHPSECAMRLPRDSRHSPNQSDNHHNPDQIEHKARAHQSANGEPTRAPCNRIGARARRQDETPTGGKGGGHCD